MFRKMFFVSALASIMCVSQFADSASADVLGECAMTGYTFMGGGSAYFSTPENTNGKDYFLASSLNYTYGTANYYGYGWVKFDVGDTAVESAYLVFDLLGVGSMSVTPATPENPAYLDVYDPSAIDVASITDVTARDTLRDNLDAASPLTSLTMTANGTHCVDITDIYNAWAIGGSDNNGLVFSTLDEGDGAKYAGFGNAAGAAPFISSSPVPEPSVFAILAAAFGAFALTRLRWKISK